MNAPRIALIVTASGSALIATAFLAVGGLALWGDGERDKDGYLSTDSHHLAASTHAIASQNIDLDFEGAQPLFEWDELGDVRLEVERGSDEPVFVGIRPHR
jgi:hypothetical protein